MRGDLRNVEAADGADVANVDRRPGFEHGRVERRVGVVGSRIGVRVCIVLTLRIGVVISGPSNSLVVALCWCRAAYDRGGLGRRDCRDGRGHLDEVQRGVYGFNGRLCRNAIGSESDDRSGDDRGVRLERFSDARRLIISRTVVVKNTKLVAVTWLDSRTVTSVDAGQSQDEVPAKVVAMGRGEQVQVTGRTVPDCTTFEVNVMATGLVVASAMTGGCKRDVVVSACRFRL